MGAQCCSLSDAKCLYTDVDNNYEYNIRKFEQDNLNAFTKTFSSIRNKSNFNSNLLDKEQTQNFLKEEFSTTIEKVINNEFYLRPLDNYQYYDYNKILSMIFLLSKHEYKVNGKINYVDKAFYLIQEINSNEEDPLNKPIEKNNKNLFNIVDILCGISLNIINTYLSINEVNDDSYFKIIIDILSTNENSLKFKQYLIKSLFYDKKNSNKDLDVLSIYDLNYLFKNYNWFLSTGHIRELAYEFTKSTN